MMRCMDCGAAFDDDEVVYESVCWEDYYGVGSSFQKKSYGSIGTCPYCGSDDLEECSEDEYEE